MIRITDIPNLEGYGVFVDDIDFRTLTRDQWIDPVSYTHLTLPTTTPV